MLALFKGIPVYIIVALLGGMGVLYLQNASKAETIEEQKEEIRMAGVEYQKLQSQLNTQNAQVLKIKEATVASEAQKVQSEKNILAVDAKLKKILVKMDELEAEEANAPPMQCEEAFKWLLQKSMEELAP